MMQLPCVDFYSASCIVLEAHIEIAIFYYYETHLYFHFVLNTFGFRESGALVCNIAHVFAMQFSILNSTHNW